MKKDLGTNIGIAAVATIGGAAASFVITGGPVGALGATIVFVGLLLWLSVKK